MSKNQHHSKVISSLLAILGLVIAGLIIITSYFLYQSTSFSRDQIQLERELDDLRARLESSENTELEPEIVFVERRDDFTVARKTEVDLTEFPSTLLQSAVEDSTNQLSCVDLNKSDTSNGVLPNDFNGQDASIRQALTKFIDTEDIPVFTSVIKNVMRSTDTRDDLVNIKSLCQTDNLLLITKDIRDDNILIVWSIAVDESNDFTFKYMNPVYAQEYSLFSYNDYNFLEVISESSSHQFYLIDEETNSLDLVESCQIEGDLRFCDREFIDQNE